MDKPAINAESLEAAVRDAAALLLAKDGRWAGETEVVNALVELGHARPLAALAVKHLIQSGRVEAKWRYFAPPIGDDWAQPTPTVSSTPDSPLADGYGVIRATEEVQAVRETMPREVPPAPPLTEAQAAVYDMIVARGPLTGKEIAHELGVTEGTVTRHYLPALQSHGIRNRRGLGYYHPDHYRRE